MKGWGQGRGKDNWPLMKKKDAHARSERIDRERNAPTEPGAGRAWPNN
jgi:hypothetical protein